jgi:hypothetical protein
MPLVKWNDEKGSPGHLIISFTTPQLWNYFLGFFNIYGLLSSRVRIVFIFYIYGHFYLVEKRGDD